VFSSSWAPNRDEGDDLLRFLNRKEMGSLKTIYSSETVASHLKSSFMWTFSVASSRRSSPRSDPPEPPSPASRIPRRTTRHLRPRVLRGSTATSIATAIWATVSSSSLASSHPFALRREVRVADALHEPRRAHRTVRVGSTAGRQRTGCGPSQSVAVERPGHELRPRDRRLVRGSALRPEAILPGWRRYG
jgi:hypothetical protein